MIHEYINVSRIFNTFLIYKPLKLFPYKNWLLDIKSALLFLGICLSWLAIPYLFIYFRIYF